MNLRACALALIVSWLAACGKAPPAAEANAATPSIVSAAGLVEPSGEERVLIPEVGGRLKRVAINEGDTVKRGQVLAEIENADYQAQVAAAEAQLARQQAELDKLRHGARAEERREARAALAEAEAAATLAQAELTRRNRMFEARQISREILDQAQANARAASARRDAADARMSLIEAGARAEDLRAAEAAVAQATAALEQARALLEKTYIRSPIDGVVLKRDLREGETVVALSPIPLARIGDVSRLSVRADVDEFDVSRVGVGQRASITSDAYPGQSFDGEVVRVSGRMGRRNLTPDDPKAKIDTKILEVEIALAPEARLPIGLRVDVSLRPR